MKKLTGFDFQEMKLSEKKAVWITAYDYRTAQFAERAGMVWWQAILSRK